MTLVQPTTFIYQPAYLARHFSRNIYYVATVKERARLVPVLANALVEK